MNQILSTENISNVKAKNKKSSGAKDINSVVKFFAIVLLIFGIFLIANSSFALNKDNSKTSSNKKVVNVEPTIELEKKGEDKLILRVLHEEGIDKVSYNWDNGDIKTKMGKSAKYLEEEIEIPAGENTLYITATDINGTVKKYEETYELETNTKIDISISGNNIKVDLTGKEEIQGFTYAWDEENPTEVKVGDKKYAMELEAPLGRHKLKVVATDINGEKSEKEQEVVGTTKPVIKLEKGNNAYKITATDEIGLDRIEITTVSDGKVVKIQADGKKLEYNFPLKQNDENFIEIMAYNENGVASKKVRAKWPR